MDNHNFDHVKKHIKAVQSTFNSQTELILNDAALTIRKALQTGNKVLLFGNGGSAADAQHIAAEFVSKLSIDRVALPGLALTVDTSAITAISNDYGFEKVFSRQVRALANKGDIAIGISTSGQSINVINGLKESKLQNLKTISFSGAKGMQSFQADYELKVDSTSTAIIQEIHIMFGHILCSLSESEYV